MKRCYANIGTEGAKEVFTFDVDDDNPDEHRRGNLSNFQPPEFAERKGLYGEAYVAYCAFRRRVQIAADRERGLEDRLGYPASSVYVDRMEDIPRSE